MPVGPGPGTSAAAITDDIGSGFDAWSITDTLTSNGSFLGYSQTPTGDQNLRAATLGWTLRSRLRVANDGDSVSNHGSVAMDYINGSTQFVMAFGSESDGDPIVSLPNDPGDQFAGATYTLQGAGSSYNLFELVFDPNENSADLFVNGIERISDYEGVAISANRVSFGALSSFDTGQGNYNLVEWEIGSVPEPSSVVLVLLGSITLLVRRSK